MHLGDGRWWHTERREKLLRCVTCNLSFVTSIFWKLLPHQESAKEMENGDPPVLHGCREPGENGVVALVLPSISNFSVSSTRRILHVIELCSQALLDEKKIGRPDCNILLLSHMFYLGYLERLLEDTSHVFLSCMQTDADINITMDSTHRKHLLHRRSISLGSIDAVIEFWRLLLAAVGGLPENDVTARVLTSMSDAESDFDMTVLRRKVALLSVRYLFQWWAHPLVYRLPPISQRGVLDLLHASMKVLTDLKALPSRSSQPLFEERASSVSTSMQASSQTLFLQSSVAGGDPGEEASSRYSLARRRRSPGESSLRQGGVDAATSPVLRSSTSEDAVDGGVVIDHAEEGYVTRVLPMIERITDIALAVEMDAVGLLLSQVYRSAHPACVALIMKGSEGSNFPSSGYSAASDSAALLRSPTMIPPISRELTTLMVLNQLHKCYERAFWTPPTLQVVHLSWLFRNAMNLFTSINDKKGEANSSLLDADISHALYGLLHAILLLLTGKVNSKTMRNSAHEVLVYLFSRDVVYKNFPERLISAVHRTFNAINGQNFRDPSIFHLIQWVTPALLILDVFAQSYLLDKGLIQSVVEELHKTLRVSAGTTSAEHRVSGWIGSSDTVISKETLDLLMLEFGGLEREDSASTGGRLRLSEDSDIGAPSGRHILEDAASPSADMARGDNNPSNEDTENEPKEREKTEHTLPEALASVKPVLYTGGLSAASYRSCVQLSLQILSQAGNKKSSAHNLLSQSCLQLLAHLLLNEEGKQEFLVLRGAQSLLCSSVSIQGLSTLVFTILQRSFEESKSLLSVMESSIRLCMTRLAKQKPTATISSSSKGPRVQLRLFLQELSPLMLRDEAVFLSLMRSMLQVQRVDKVTYVSLISAPPSTPTVGSAADHSANVGILDRRTTTPSHDRAVSSSASMNTPSETRGKLVSGVESSFKSKSISHKKLDSAGGVACASLSHPLSPCVYASFETILVALCSQLAKVLEYFRGNLEDEKEAFSSSECCLTITDLFLILADLVYTIPGLATCIHRFNMNKLATSQNSALVSCIANTRHAITSQPISPTRILTFLVHNLVEYDTQLDDFCQRSLSSASPAGVARFDAVKALVGPSLEDSVSYFLASLIARPGDGRRRALEEILDVLRVLNFLFLTVLVSNFLLAHTVLGRRTSGLVSQGKGHDGDGQDCYLPYNPASIVDLASDLHRTH